MMTQVQVEQKDSTVRQKRVKTVVSQCEKCVKVLLDNTCLAFSDPSFQWADGKVCYGFLANVDGLFAILDKIEGYGGNLRSFSLIRECIRKHARY